MTADTVMGPVHPGEMMLEEFLKPLAVRQFQLAKEIAVPARRIGAGESDDGECLVREPVEAVAGVGEVLAFQARVQAPGEAAQFRWAPGLRHLRPGDAAVHVASLLEPG